MPIFLPETFRAPTGLQRAGHGSVAARARTAGRPSSLAPLALGWRRGQHVGVRFLSIFKVQASSHRLNSFPLLLYQSLGHIRLCATLWTVAHQAPGTFKAGILQWAAISSSRGSFQPRD